MRTREKLMAGVITVVMLGVLALLALFFFGKVRHGVYAGILLTGHETTTGWVYQSGAGRNEASYDIDVNGRSYRGRAGRDRSGDRVGVAYWGRNPAVNRPVGGLWFDVLIGAAIIGAIPILIVRFIYTERRRQAQIEAEEAGGEVGAPPGGLRPVVVASAWAAGGIVVLASAAVGLVLFQASPVDEPEREVVQVPEVLEEPEVVAPAPVEEEPAAPEPVVHAAAPQRIEVVWAGFGSSSPLVDVAEAVRAHIAENDAVSTWAVNLGLAQGDDGHFQGLFRVNGVLVRLSSAKGARFRIAEESAIDFPPGVRLSREELRIWRDVRDGTDGVRVIWARFGREHEGEDRYVACTQEAQAMLDAHQRIQNDRKRLGVEDPVRRYDKGLAMLLSVRGELVYVWLPKTGLIVIGDQADDVARPSMK